MRRAWLGVLAAFIAGGIFAAVAASGADRPMTLDLGVLPATVITVLSQNQTACQSPVGMPADSGRSVLMWLGPLGQPRGPAEVTIRRGGPNGAVMARSTRPMRPIGAGWTTFRLDREVRGPGDIAICLQN